MPKVTHVKKAQKAKPEHGIAVGDSYYHWGVMIGGRGVKRYSKTEPTRQQLTQSEYLIACYDLEDRINSEELTPDDIDEIVSDIRQLGEEQDEKLNNLPDSLQNGQTGELLTARKDACDAWADEIESHELEEVSDEDAEAEIDDDDVADDDPAIRDEDGEIIDQVAFDAAKAKAIEEKRAEMEAEKLDEWREEVRGCASAADAS